MTVVLILAKTLRHSHYSQFANEKTEALKCSLTSPRLHRKYSAESRFKYKLGASRRQLQVREGSQRESQVERMVKRIEALEMNKSDD